MKLKPCKVPITNKNKRDKLIKILDRYNISYYKDIKSYERDDSWYIEFNTDGMYSHGSRIDFDYKLTWVEVDNFEKFQKGRRLMSIKDGAKTLYEKIEPYQGYIIAGAAIVVLDYFIFDGSFSGRIKKLGEKLYSKLEKLLDSAIDSVGE